MDGFWERVGEVTQNLASWIVIGGAGSVGWLVRRILTNQREIEMLRAEMRGREEMRLRDREDMARLERKVDKMTDLLMRDRHGEH